MHGVPKDLDLKHLVGAEVQRIDLGMWILHFRFSDPATTTISVEGEWTLRDSSERVVDRQTEASERDCYRLHVLLGREVTAVEVQAPEAFIIRFAGGYTLEIRDVSKQYESFSIEPPGIYV